MTAKIIQLPTFSGTPTGSEIFEVSVAGTGSFQIAMAVLAASRQANIVASAGTVTVGNSSYGDYLVTTTGAVTINLPSALLRGGVPVSVIAATTGTPNITIVPFGAQTIFGLVNNLTITNSYGAFTLWPNTVATGDWYQK